jgi:hypothetical protein
MADEIRAKERGLVAYSDDVIFQLEYNVVPSGV